MDDPRGRVLADELGPMVVRAVRAECLLVLTPPRARSLVEDRFRGVLDDFDFAAGETER